jgi:hypothetical protein
VQFYKTYNFRAISEFFKGSSTTKMYDATSIVQQDIMEKLVKFVAKTYEPFSLVENENFRELVKSLNPAFAIPGVKGFKCKMQEKYKSKVSEVAEILNDKKNTVASVSVDYWSSGDYTSYVTLTASLITEQWLMMSLTLAVKEAPGHHDAQHTKIHLEDLLKEWNLNANTLYVVRDEGSDLKSACDNLMKWRGSLRCFDHALQRAVLDCIDKKKNEPLACIVEQAKIIVRHFHGSPLQTNNLIIEAKKYEAEGITFCKLKQECPTRWGSLYELMNRLLAMKKPVSHVLSDSAPNLVPSAQFWVEVEQICRLLKPLKVISEKMCAEKSPTLSSVYPVLMNVLRNIVWCSDTDTELIKRTKTILKEGIEKRFISTTQLKAMQIAAVMDPRFKNLVFLNTEARKSAYKEVKKELKENYDQVDEDNDSDDIQMIEPVDLDDDENESTRSKNKKKDAAVDFDIYGDILTNNTNYSQPQSSRTAAAELAQFLCEPILEKDQDPLLWWKLNAYRFPKLAKCAKFFLGITATNVCAERSFSTAGLILTEKRNRLKSNNVKMLHFLAKNL